MKRTEAKLARVLWVVALAPWAYVLWQVLQ